MSCAGPFGFLWYGFKCSIVGDAFRLRIDTSDCWGLGNWRPVGSDAGGVIATYGSLERGAKPTGCAGRNQSTCSPHEQGTH